MYVAAIAWHVPCEQAIFSTGRRASSKLLEQVLSLINHLPGAEDRIVKSNQEMIWIKHPGNRVAKISSYPSCAKTLRGVGADIVYMEEAAFMDLEVSSNFGFFFLIFTGNSHVLLSVCRCFIKSSFPCLKWTAVR